MEQNHDSERLVSAEYLLLQKQIQISLRFHHQETLKQLPRELALQAMNEAWCISAKAHLG